jgi:CheY-like chemotaxis protein
VSDLDATVVVADDDLDILELVAIRLDRLGCNTLRATDGGEALSLAREHHPDLLVLDVLMPKLNGFQVMRALRDDPATREIPTLILTATIQDERVSAEYGVTPEGYMRKPFVAAAFEAMVRKLLS